MTKNVISVVLEDTRSKAAAESFIRSYPTLGKFGTLRSADGWPLHHHELYPLLGLKAGHHLPDAGLPAREINGVTVWVEPKGGRGQRTKAICPRCDRVFAAGNLCQHQLFCKEAV